MAKAGDVYSSLRRRFKGDLLRPGDGGYQDARTIWNGMVARSPGLIARCVDVSDIQNAVRAAERWEFSRQSVAAGIALQASALAKAAS